MNPQMAPPNQAQYQGQFPPQHQNVGQQRQAPNPQMQSQGAGQQKPVQGQQQFQNPYANWDPQLALFTLEKPKNAKTWEDVEPEQQHVSLSDLQNELNKFRRNKISVKRALNEISSANCRRLINELVEDQTQQLWKYNKTIQYRIASVEVEWRDINRRERILKRVQVILETEPSGYQEPQLMRAGGGIGNGHAAQDPNKAKQNNMPQNQQYQGPAMSQSQHLGQQPKPMQQQQHQPQTQPQTQPQPQHMGQSQHFDQQSMRIPPPPGQAMGNGPPPPPPPPGAQGLGGPGMGTPLPPPPPPNNAHVGHMPPHPMQNPQIQNVTPGRSMPGSFPDSMPMPVSGMRQGQMPHFETMNPEFLRDQKAKHKGRHSSSSSASDNDWESECSSSSSGHIRVRPVEHGDYGLVGRRERGRSQHSTKSRKSHHNRSESKGRSRSRSRLPVIVDPYNPKSSRRRRNSESYGPPPIGKYSPVSSKASSPRSSRPEIPPIHIHMNSNSTSLDESRDNMRDRRASMNPYPSDFYRHKRILEKIDTSEPMSREGSWDRASGTASFGTSSVFTSEDPVFDSPMRRPSLSHGHGRPKSYSRRSRMDDVVDRYPKPKYQYPEADDYPHMRDSYFEEPTFVSRPGIHRRNSVQVPGSNPFAPSHYPPKPTRAMSYAADMHDPGYTFPPRRAIADRVDTEDRLELQEIADALEHIKESRRAPLKRRGGDMRSSAVFSGDEWDVRYPPMRRGTYSDHSY